MKKIIYLLLFAIPFLNLNAQDDTPSPYLIRMHVLEVEGASCSIPCNLCSAAVVAVVAVPKLFVVVAVVTVGSPLLLQKPYMTWASPSAS